MPRRTHSYHFLYKTTCTVTGKYYVGMHSTSELEDGYFGSGKRLGYSLKKHGKENHIREILEFFSDREFLRVREKEIVNEEMLRDPLCMNLNEGGDGSWHRSNDYLRKHPEELKKISSAGGRGLIKRWRNDREFGEAQSRRISEQNEKLHREGKMKVPNWQGKSPSLSHRASMSIAMASAQKGEKNSQFGTVWIFHPVEKRNLKARPDQLAEYLKQGWCKGRIKVA